MDSFKTQHQGGSLNFAFQQMECLQIGEVMVGRFRAWGKAGDLVEMTLKQ